MNIGQPGLVLEGKKCGAIFAKKSLRPRAGHSLKGNALLKNCYLKKYNKKNIEI
ncbi:MAG: hypothetical protein IKP51_05005 [Treponema sp.]|nr:hypothetical protein [Treponema sp.]